MKLLVSASAGGHSGAMQRTAIIKELSVCLAGSQTGTEPVERGMADLADISAVHSLSKGQAPNGAWGCTPHNLLGVSGSTGPAHSEIGVSADEQLNAAIAQFQGELADWRYGRLSLSKLAATLQGWAHGLWEEFLPKQWKGHPVMTPKILFGFRSKARRVLGRYCRGRNETGLRWEINVNPVNLCRLTEMELAAIVLHELLHCFEDLIGQSPRNPNGYHSRWLRETAERLGMPCKRYGCLSELRNPSPFLDWARQRGLRGEPVLVRAEQDQLKKPKRTPWVCACPSDVAVAVYVSAGSELRARCTVCNAMYRPKAARNHDL